MKKDFGSVFWLHLSLIILLWTTSFWIDWILILVGVVILHIYWFFFDGCHLTKLEAGNDKDATFYHHYLSKVFPNLNKKRVKMVVRYLIPIFILIIAYVIQEIYFRIPFINF